MTRLVIILSLISIVFYGCEADFEVFRDGEPTPIVYCILDLENPTQKLRLSRSYKSYQPSEAPVSSDSLLFDSALDIVIEQIKDGLVEKQAFFAPVDVVKEDGFFPVTEHWIYETDMEILSNTSYQIIVYLNEYEKIVYSACTAFTALINPPPPFF